MNRRFISVLLFGAAALALGWLFFGYFGVQALFIDTMVQDKIPVASTAPLSSSSTSATTPVYRGDFIQGDSTYSIQGTATIVSTAHGRQLVLDGFTVTNGPDLYVYAVGTSSTENKTVKLTVEEGGFQEIAKLKGNKGTQVYALPDTFDVDRYPTVSIWCKRFARNFGSVTLFKE